MSSSVEKSLFDADCLGNNSLIKLAQTSTADGPHGSRSVVRRKVAISSSSSSNLEANLSSQPVLVLNSSSLQPQNQSVTENTGQIGIDDFVDEFLATQSNQNASSRLSSSGAFVIPASQWSNEFVSFTGSLSRPHPPVIYFGRDFRSAPLLHRLPQVIRSTNQNERGNAEKWADQFSSSQEDESTNDGRKSDQDGFESAWSEAEGQTQEDGASTAEIFDNLEQEWQNILKKYEEQQTNNTLREQMESAWMSEEDEAIMFGAGGRGGDYLDHVNRYRFNEENPFEGVEDALQKGIERLKAGDIPNAVLLFEEAVKQSEEKERAWFYLGVAQTENENDEAAIRALNETLQLNENNLEALMALSASYTNEGDMARAVDTLELWLQKNSTFSGIPTLTLEEPQEDSRSPLSVSSLFRFQSKSEDLLKLFEQALMVSPQDVNVLTAVGILNCVRNDYATAANIFRQCVGLDPKNALLWNRLGACLANGDRSEEAISAYRNALNLRPGYIRARFNLGVACQNLHSHKEAIEHFLVALNMQAQASGPKGEKSETSSAIWTNLITSIHKIGAFEELSRSVVKRDLKSLSFHFAVNI
ncbi:peroxisomal targeting signal 1 receptor-like [Symsagittifera roscoffensis]|uniref:peroxisomal targeting signal 1 receptor-like n=1 Tax=Symsagittifera roscoffensis TaxID=84072 RepID=UPI00307BAC74